MLQVGAQSETFDAVILALPFTRCARSRGWRVCDLGEEKLKMHSRAWLRDECQGLAAAPPRACGGVLSRACPRRRTAPSIPISVSRICGTRAAPSRATAGIITDFLGVKAWPERREVRTRRFPRRPSQDVAEDGRKSRPERGHVVVLGVLSLTRSAAMPAPRSDNTPRCLEVAAEPGAWRPPAICRRAYQRRLPRLHERWRRKRKPCRRRADRDHGTAQMR